MARALTPLEVHNIKLLICEGVSQTDVARAMDVSQGSVSKICLGDTHRDIPWPNAAVGEKLGRKRGVRSQRDEVQAQLASGLPSLPVPQRPEPTQVIQATEQDAVEMARQEAAQSAGVKKEIYRRVAEMQEQEEKDFREAMKGDPDGVPDPNDPAVMPTAWEVSFLPWEEVLERAGGLDIVKVAEKDGGEILKRAIGIVLHSLDEETWDGDQALKIVESVVEQLEASSALEAGKVVGLQPLSRREE